MQVYDACVEAFTGALVVNPNCHTLDAAGAVRRRRVACGSTRWPAAEIFRRLASIAE
jgi:hypothetical protein